MNTDIPIQSTDQCWRAMRSYDVRFPEKKWATFHEDGNTIIRAVSYGMPKIDSRWLNSVFYLYKTVKAARTDSKSGGTGFIVGYPLKIEGRDETEFAIYAVSNHHVVCDKGCSIARLTAQDGTTSIFVTDPSDWIHIPGGNDITVTFIPFDKHESQYSFISTDDFIDQDDSEMGIGDGVFMLGRFVDSEHSGINVPSARFGHISMMPQPIKDHGRTFDSYCLDMHSRSGYSGSPVLVYRTPGRDLSTARLTPEFKLKLLGIHWGQFAEYWEIKDRPRIQESALLLEGKHVKGVSGMTCVAPAWDILKILELPKMIDGRKRAEKQLSEQYRDKPTPVMKESADDSDAAETLRDETLGRMLNTPPKPRNN